MQNIKPQDSMTLQGLSRRPCRKRPGGAEQMRGEEQKGGLSDLLLSLFPEALGTPSTGTPARDWTRSRILSVPSH